MQKYSSISTLIFWIGLLPITESFIEFSFYPIKDRFLIDEHVLFRFQISNNYTNDILFLPWTTPLDPSQAYMLSLTRNETSVTYTCPVVSRLPPTLQDYVLLSSGASMSIIYNVSNCYVVDTVGNYSANASMHLWGNEVTSGFHFHPDTVCYADLSIYGIRFCIVENEDESCAEIAGNKVFNTSFVSSGSSPFISSECLLLFFGWAIFFAIRF